MIALEAFDSAIGMSEIGARVRQINALKLSSQTDTPVMLDRHNSESTGLLSLLRRKNGACLMTFRRLKIW
jgi:hypothetical protein